MNESPRADVDRLVDHVAASIRRELGDQLVGLYLYGSVVTSGFEPGLSDIDLLAATAGDVDDVTLQRLREMHAAIVAWHPAWEDRIEVAYLSCEGLQTFRDRRTSMAIISPGEPLHYRSAGADWLMNWYLVRERGRTLFGPPPAELIPPIATDALIEALREHARWRARTMEDVRGLPAQSYTVLTMCRTLRTHQTGQLVSKREAAIWTADAYPAWSDLIRQVLAWRERMAEYRNDDSAPRPDVRAFIAMVARAVDER